MRGFTERLKRLEVGESMDVEGSTRPNIYMMAKRVGISVSAIGKGRSFRVTKVGYRDIGEGSVDNAVAERSENTYERSAGEGSVKDDGER